MGFFRWVVLISWFGIFFGSVKPVFSQEEGAPPQKTVDEKFNDLDQKVRILERRLDLQQEGAAEKAKEAPGVVSGKDGFSLKSADGQFQLKLRGLIHVDARFLKPDTDTFLLRRVRPILEGTIYNIFDFRFTPDFGGGAAVIRMPIWIPVSIPRSSSGSGSLNLPSGWSGCSRPPTSASSSGRCRPIWCRTGTSAFNSTAIFMMRRSAMP